MVLGSSEFTLPIKTIKYFKSLGHSNPLRRQIILYLNSRTIHESVYSAGVLLVFTYACSIGVRIYLIPT